MGETKKVKIIWGTPSFWMNVFPLYYGKHKGFFEKRGIDLEVKYFYGGPELAGAVREGEIHVGTIGLPPFSKAFAEGLPARIIGSAIIQQLDHYLVARPDIDKLIGLKGKKIGILSFGSCDEYFIRHMLEGVDVDTEFELVPLGRAYGDLDCFSSGKIDAGFLVEPKVTLGESMGLLKVLARVGDYFPRYQWCVIFASNDFIRKHADLTHRILDAYRESCRRIKENPEESIGFGSKLFGLKEDIFRRALHRDLANWEIEAKIDLVGLKNCLQIQEQVGAIPCDLANEEMVCHFSPSLFQASLRLM
jgi:NitT/TauT family transport system substrate-binding protein